MFNSTDAVVAKLIISGVRFTDSEPELRLSIIDDLEIGGNNAR